MIHEKGELQIIDFGVAGVLPTKLDKRSTMIGSLHWMAPEMHLKNPGLKYGTEVRFSGFRVRERCNRLTNMSLGRRMGVRLYVDRVCNRKPPESLANASRRY